MNNPALCRLLAASSLFLCAWFSPAAAFASCEPGALVDAFVQASSSTARIDPGRPIAAEPLAPEQLLAMPALARMESLLRRVGLPLAWHQMDSAALEAALQASGGALIVATRSEGPDTHCLVLTQADPQAGRPASPTLLALLPAPGAPAALSPVSVQQVVRGMVADFRLAMRVGAQYAPEGAWVISPWLTRATLRRSQQVDSPVPGLPPGQADTRVRLDGVGVGLSRGLTRDTSVTLLLTQQRSESTTEVTFPALGPLATQHSVGRQDDTIAGLGVYSQLVRESAGTPSVLLNARLLAASAHNRAGGNVALHSLLDLGHGWGLAAAIGAEAQRPEEAPSQHTRFATLGASAQFSGRWMATVDAGRREVRDLPGTQPVQRLRLYQSFSSMAYLALVVDREAQDRRTTVTFARPL
ncbi:MAG: hypothetical protein RLZZ180_2050 [Pseudomonadota bacterium]